MEQQNIFFTGHLMAVQPLATASKDLADSRSKDGPTPVPSFDSAEGLRLYFPATGLRGRLRRASRDVLRRAESARTQVENPFSLEQHYFLTLGGVKGSGASDKTSVLHEQRFRSSNPLLSLFGAGDAGVLDFVAGRLNMGNAFAEPGVKAMLFSGARSDDLYRDRAQLQYLSDGDLNALVRQSEAIRERSKLDGKIESLERTQRKIKDKTSGEYLDLDKQISQMKDEQTKVVSEAGGTGMSVGRPLAGWLAIPPGTRLTHKISLARSTQIELGCLLAALREWSDFPYVGAHLAAGCGEISGEWAVWSAQRGTRTELGVVKLAAGEFSLEGEALQQALTAFEAFAASDAMDLCIPVVE